MNRKLGILILGFAMLTACRGTVDKPSSNAAQIPVGPNEIGKYGLKLTKEGIEFADAECIGAYNSQVTDVLTNEGGRRISYKITSTCTSNGDVYTWVYSNITYNLLGQQTGYNLKISSSKCDKEIDLVCTNILRDNAWEAIKYDVKIGSNSYQFKRI